MNFPRNILDFGIRQRENLQEAIGWAIYISKQEAQQILEITGASRIKGFIPGTNLYTLEKDNGEKCIYNSETNEYSEWMEFHKVKNIPGTHLYILISSDGDKCIYNSETNKYSKWMEFDEAIFVDDELRLYYGRGWSNQTSVGFNIEEMKIEGEGSY